MDNNSTNNNGAGGPLILRNRQLMNPHSGGQDGGTDGPVRGVRTAAGVVAADAVVCNADLPGAYRLVPGLAPPRRLRRPHCSPSAVVWHAGVRGGAGRAADVSRTPGIGVRLPAGLRGCGRRWLSLDSLSQTNQLFHLIECRRKTVICHAEKFRVISL